MASQEKSVSFLPTLPRKVRVKSDHLSFRVPSNTSALERAKNLETKIKSLQVEEEKLKRDKEELREKCAKELREIDGQYLQDTRLPNDFARKQYRRPRSYGNIQNIFNETKAALLKAISPDNELERLQKKKSSRLQKVQEEVALEKEMRDMNQRKMMFLKKRLRNLTDKLDGLRANFMLERERNDLSEGDYETNEEEDNSQREHQNDDTQTEAMKERENRGDSEMVEMTNKDLKTMEERDGKHNGSRTLRHSGNENEDKDKRKQRAKEVRKDIQKLDDRVKETQLKEKIEVLEEDIDKCEEIRKQAERYIGLLKKREEGIGQELQGNEEQQRETETRQDTEMDSEEEPMDELAEQIKRKGLIQRLMREMQYEMVCGVGWRLDDLNFDDSEEKRQAHILERLSGLEGLVTRVRRLRQKITRVRDLRTILEKELALERNWTGQANETAKSDIGIDVFHNEKDHLASNILKESKVYKPLLPGELRLLFLMPAPKECRYFPLLCALETKSWERPNRKEYAALSYCWGSDPNSGSLFLLQDGLPKDLDMDEWGSTARRAIRIPIRDNLFRALLRLRRQDNPVALWVDFLCINQSDSAEKTVQLDNLVNVYHRARNVCIWLGETDAQGRSDSAMDFIPTIMDFAVLDRYAKDRQQAKRWFALAELMRDRWFSRRWVVQEVSLAKSATVHCGDKSVHWSDFSDAVSLLASNQETIRNLFDFSEWREGPNTLGDVKSFGAYILLEATSRLFLRTAKGNIRTPITSIESLVTSLKTFDMSDRRDLIYSFVSIAKDTSRNSDIYSCYV